MSTQKIDWQDEEHSTTCLRRWTIRHAFAISKNQTTTNDVAGIPVFSSFRLPPQCHAMHRWLDRPTGQTHSTRVPADRSAARASAQTLRIRSVRQPDRRGGTHELNDINRCAKTIVRTLDSLRSMLPSVASERQNRRAESMTKGAHKRKGAKRTSGASIGRLL